MGLTHVTVRIDNLAKTGEPYEDEFLPAPLIAWPGPMY